MDKLIAELRPKELSEDALFDSRGARAQGSLMVSLCVSQIARRRSDSGSPVTADCTVACTGAHD